METNSGAMTAESSLTFQPVYRQELQSTVNFMLQREGIHHRIFGRVLSPVDSRLTDTLTNRLASALSCCHPEWSQDLPPRDTLRKFLRGVSYLPPMGGKTPLVITQGRIELPTGTKDVWYQNTDEEERSNQLAQTFGLEPSKTIDSPFKKILGMPNKVITEVRKKEWLPIVPPCLTAEEHVADIIKRRQQGELGDAFVHQLTVQGRLPDQFKYMAIALILNGSYGNNWEEPFFSASWGGIAPMIHDGGNTQSDLNPLWQGASGRTDFLQRVSLVRAPNLEELERLPIKEVGKLSKSTLDDAKAEQAERARLVLETKAYQRLALALHCQVDTAPRSIPGDVRYKLVTLWREFCSSIDNIAAEYDIKGALGVTWFTKQPQQQHSLSGFGPRYEAPWEPIRDELTKLEGIRSQHPELRNMIGRILENFTQKIDQAIGLV